MPLLWFKEKAKLIDYFPKEFQRQPIRSPVCKWSEYYLIKFLAISVRDSHKIIPTSLLVSGINGQLVMCSAIEKKIGERTRLILSSERGVLDGTLVLAPGSQPRSLRTIYDRSIENFYSPSRMTHSLFETLRAAQVVQNLDPNSKEINTLSTLVSLLTKLNLGIGSNFLSNIRDYSPYITKHTDIQQTRETYY